MKNKTPSLPYFKYLQATQKILNESQHEKETYKTSVCGREFFVFPNVFSPKYFSDTEVFARELPLQPGDSILEIGPGTGAISITAIYHGAKKVVAVDINHAAVQSKRPPD